MSHRRLLTIALIAILTTSLFISGTLHTNSTPTPESTQTSYENTNCTHRTATDEITNKKPKVTITTISGMPNESFNPYAQNIPYNLKYNISITLPNNTTTGTISLPDNTTFTSTTNLENVTNDTAQINNTTVKFTINSNKLDDITGKKYKTYEPYAIYSNIPDILLHYPNACVNIGTRESNTTMNAKHATIYHTEKTYYKIPHNETFHKETITHNNTTVTIIKPNNLPLQKSNMSTVTTRTKHALETYTNYPDNITIYIVPESVTAASGISMSQGPNSNFIWVTTRVDPHGPLSVLTHELMHARQQYDLGPKMSWFTEGSAEYMATNGPDEPTLKPIVKPYYPNDYADKEPTPVLTNASTWEGATPYNKGALVLYHLNEKLEPHGYTVNKLLLWMNQHDGEVTYDEFLTKIETESNTSVKNWTDKHVNETALPPTEPNENNESNYQVII